MPVSAAARISNAYHLSVRRRVALLDALVMAASNDSAISIGKHRANRQSTLLKALPGLADRFC
jgi:hypothetical protein